MMIVDVCTDSKVLICKFHRKQAWNRKLAKIDQKTLIMSL